MRLLLLIVTIALLPLRGWVGDVMAMEMASGQLNATKNGASSSYYPRTVAGIPINSGKQHSECHELVAAAVAPDAGVYTTELPSEAAHGDCGNCSACQICQTAAVIGVIRTNVDATLPPFLQPDGHTQFASATPAPRLKPPIS